MWKPFLGKHLSPSAWVCLKLFCSIDWTWAYGVRGTSDKPWEGSPSPGPATLNQGSRLGLQDLASDKQFLSFN